MSGCGQVVEPVAELGFGPGGEVGDEHQQVGGGVLGFGRRETDGGGAGGIGAIFDLARATTVSVRALNWSSSTSDGSIRSEG